MVGKGVCVWEEELCGKSLYFPLDFCCEFPTGLKNNSINLKKCLGVPAHARDEVANCPCLKMIVI